MHYMWHIKQFLWFCIENIYIFIQCLLNITSYVYDHFLSQQIDSAYGLVPNIYDKTLSKPMYVSLHHAGFWISH